MPALLSTSATSVVAYDDARALPEGALAALAAHPRESNVVLSGVEKALARTDAPKRKEHWIVCTTDDAVEFVLSCTEGVIGSYPVFIYSTQPSSDLRDDFLHHRLTLLAQKLVNTVGVARVFSVFALERVTQVFQHLWSQLTGIAADPTPYYAATFTHCDKSSFVEHAPILCPSYKFDLRPAVETDIPAVADLCYGFAQGSEPFVLSPEGALKEAAVLVRSKQVWVHDLQRGDKPMEIASIVCFTRQSTTVAAITKVYTNPLCRKMGCAERLVRRVTQILLKSKLSVVLYVAHENQAAANVYHRVGFQGLDQPERSVEGVESWLEIGFDTNLVELGHCATSENLLDAYTGERSSSKHSIVPPIRRHTVDLETSISGHVPTQRSLAAMRGLLRAEVGDSMVQMDVYGTGFEDGQRIAPPPVTNPRCSQDGDLVSDIGLIRDDTLLGLDAHPARTAAELKSLLGDNSSRLKPGAAVIPPPSPSINTHGRSISQHGKVLALEQAKSRVRVQVDIILETDTCVQGSIVSGKVQVHVRETFRTEPPVWLGKARVRIIGFEYINENDRHTFYQCTTSLATNTASLYSSAADDEGFAEAREGSHCFPFAIQLPLDDSCGVPMGVIQSHSGATVRYIAMASFKVKCPATNERSIAHFYRNCEIWPRLEYANLTAPASEPLSAQVSKGIFLGGKGKIILTAELHRLNWFAGQRCYLTFSITNNTKRAVKRLTLALVRTTTVFKPKPHLDALPGACPDPDACQTSTTRKQVATSVLEMAHTGEKGHASAKGWWTGVPAGQRLDFSHYLILPADALTFTRVRLLEVAYNLRVTIGAGSLGADVHVVLPIRIFNLISVDPPVSRVLPQKTTKIINKEPYTVRELRLLERTGTAHTSKQDSRLAGSSYVYDEETTPHTSATARFDDIAQSLQRYRSNSETSLSVYEENNDYAEQHQAASSVVELPESFAYRNLHPQSSRPLSLSRPRFALVDPGPGPVRRPTSFEKRVQKKIHEHASEPAETVAVGADKANNGGVTSLELYDLPPVDGTRETSAQAVGQPEHRPPSEVRWKPVESLNLPTPPFSRFTTPTSSAASSPTSLVPGVPYRPSHSMPRPPMVVHRTDPGPSPVHQGPKEEYHLPHRESETFVLPVFRTRSEDPGVARIPLHRHSSSVGHDPLPALKGSGFSVKSRVQEVEVKVEDLKRRTDGMVPFYH
ncbi:hypothetical protein HWV62_18680 [Athelia sp. TMB]|nr:hypothetical protein HWV62_18680 [Athelia sp. TMB]